MLTRNRALLFALVLASAGAAAGTPGTAAAAPCHNGGGCSISGHYHSGGGGGGGGTTGGGGGSGGGGNSGPGLGCPNQGPQIVCTPGNPAPAANPHVPTIDVARNARDQIVVPAPHVNTAPAGRTYVQLKTGLWVGQADYVTRSISLTVFDQTVTATATPQSVTWDMGESTVVCTGPGTPDGTECGYTYTRSSAGRPGGKYAISATITWALAWTCQGNCDAAGGQLAPLTMTTAAQLAVGEIQTESNRG